jgi:hypothetical protein
MEIEPSLAPNVVVHREVELTEPRNAFKGLDPQTAAAIDFRGSRTIRADAPPGPDSPGLTGDLWIVENAQGSPSAYRCTTPGPAHAIWEPVSSIP